MLHIPEEEKVLLEQKNLSSDEKLTLKKKEEELEEMINSPPKNPLAIQAKKAVEKNESAVKSMPTMIDRFEIPCLLIFYLCTCWVLGYFNFNPLWFLGALFSMVFLYKRRAKRFSELELFALRREAAKKGISSHEESAEWINYILGRIWGVYEPVLCATIIEGVNEALEEACPVFLNSLKLTTFTLGSEPPVILGFRSYPDTPDDVVHFEVRFAFVPRRSTEDIMYPLRRGVAHHQWSSQVVLAARFGSSLVGVDIPVLVENISIEVHARIQLKLMAAPPVVKIAQVSLMSPPKIDFVLKPLKTLDIMDLPGLHSFIKSTIETISSEIAVNPNSIIINVDELINGAILAGQKPTGVLCIGIIGAKIPKTTEYIGTVDPFVSVIVDGIEIIRTKELIDQQEPKWGETFWIMLPNEKSEVKLQVIHAASLVTKEIMLGEMNIDINSILKVATAKTTPGIQEENSSTTKDKFFFSGWSSYMAPSSRDHSAVVKGELNYSVAFFPALSWINPDKNPMEFIDDAGILDLTLHQAVELTPKKSTQVKAMNVYAEGAIVPTHLIDISEEHSHKLKLDSFASIPSASYFKTHIKKKTNAPIWSQRMKTFIKDASSYSLWVQIREERDLSGPSLIGELILSLADNLLQKDTTQEDDWFQLDKNSSGKVRITYSWDPIIDLEDAESLELEASGGESGSAARIPSVALAHLTILEMDNLPKTYHPDSGVYIKVFLGGSKGNAGGIDPILTTRNVSPGDTSGAPSRLVWLDGTWTFIKSLENTTVLFELFEAGTGSFFKPTTILGQHNRLLKRDNNDRLLASTVLNVFDVINDPASFLNCWLNFQATGEPTNFCRLRIELAAWPTLSPEKPIHSSHKIGILRVKLLRTEGFTDQLSESIKFSTLVTGLRLMGDSSSTNIGDDIGSEFISIGAKKGSTKQPEWKEAFEWIVMDAQRSSLVVSVRSKAKKAKKKMNLSSLGDVQISIQDIISKQQTSSITASKNIPSSESGGGSLWTFTDFNPKYFRKADVLLPGIWMDVSFKPLDINYSKMEDSKEALNELLSFLSIEEVPGYIVLRISSASNLVAADASGTSDPFTIINLNGIKVGKTSVIKKTLNPEWNERFVLPVRSLRYAILGLEVFDWNRIDSFVHIGTFSIPILRMILESTLSKRQSGNNVSAFYRDVPPEAISDSMLAESTWDLTNTENGTIHLQVAFVENASEFTSLTEHLYSSGGLMTSTKGFFKGVGHAFVGGATTVVAAPFTGGKFLAKKGLGLFSRPGKVKESDGPVTSPEPKTVNFDEKSPLKPLHKFYIQLKGILFSEKLLLSSPNISEHKFYVKVRREGALVAKSKHERVALNKTVLFEDTSTIHFELPLFEGHNEPIIFHTKFTTDNDSEVDTISNLVYRFTLAPEDINLTEKHGTIWLQEIPDDKVDRAEHSINMDQILKKKRSEVSKSFAFEQLLKTGDLFEKFKSKLYKGAELPNSMKSSSHSYLSLDVKRIE